MVLSDSQQTESLEYISRIHTQYATLSRSQKRIANYILNHQESVVHYSITQLAEKTGTVPSTITRFCQALSYKGFSELKLYIEKGLVSPNAISNTISLNDSLPVIIQKLMKVSEEVIADTQRTLNPDTIKNTVTSILRAKTVLIYGQSGGHVSALYAQQMLLRAGIRSLVINDPVDMNIAACTLEPHDVVIGIAYSGEAKSVIQAMENARKRRAVLISITAAPNSTMAKRSRYRLYYSHNIPDDLLYLHMGSMCEIAILGAIQAELLRRPEQAELISSCRQAVLDSRQR